jgi:hypothetical protein
MTSQGTAHGRFQRAINRRHLLAAEMAAREMGGLSLADALMLCELLAKADPARYERAALRWLEGFIEERLPPLTASRTNSCGPTVRVVALVNASRRFVAHLARPKAYLQVILGCQEQADRPEWVRSRAIRPV